MSTRKYLSGYEKRKKKRKTKEFLQSQVGAMDKFLSNTSNVDKEIYEKVQDEKDINEEGENLVNKEDLDDCIQEILKNVENRNEQHDNLEENMNEQQDDLDTHVVPLPLDITNPGNWKIIDQNLIDMLVKRGPSKVKMDNFPKDSENRHFSSTHYTRYLSNGEKTIKKWLVYSISLDKVFCFCCKLFKQKENTFQLANEGTNDWKNISYRLKSHETSNEHMQNMRRWIELERRLQKNLTIDKALQDQINKDGEHWRQVFVRIVSVVSFLCKNNLAFRGSTEKIYEENNRNFLGIIEMIAEFDPIMK